MESGRWKIGKSVNPESRFKSLQTGAAEELAPWGVLPCSEPGAMERYLHKRFAKHRLHGEWFARNDEIEWFFERWGYEYGGVVRLWTALNPPDEGPPPRPHPAFRHLLAPVSSE